MEPLIQVIVLAAATVLAAGAAIALNWVLLQSAFRLMQPAGVSRWDSGSGAGICVAAVAERGEKRDSSTAQADLSAPLGMTKWL